MKTSTLIARIFGAFVSLALLLAIVFFATNKESQTLDAAERERLGVDFIKLTQGEVHYELRGTDTAGTVVLVHGFSIPGYIWDRNIDALIDAGYRVLRFDLYGRGYSARPDIDYDIDLFVEQLNELTSSLNISTPFHLVGFSMGGPITTRFSHRYADKVQSLSLLAPLVVTPERSDLKLLSVPYLGEYLASVVMMPKIANGLARTVYDVNSFPQWHDKMAQHIHYRGYRQALLSTLRYLTGKSFESDYEKLAVTDIPSQLIWGREDQVVNYDQASRIQALVPNIPLTILEETGHLPQIEQSEKVNTLLLQHFAHAARNG